MSADFIKTYVKGLDERVEGGIPEGSIVLICGTPGTLKTTFCYNVLSKHALETGEKGLYIALEQHRDSILTQMSRMGFNPRATGELVTIVDLAHLRNFISEESTPSEIDWLSVLTSQIRFFQEEGYKLVTIDSLDAMYVISPMENVRSRLFFFFEGIRALGMTTFFITEMQPGTKSFGKFGVEGFLADGIVHLEIERVGKSVGRFISIVKIRGSSHPADYFPMIVEKGGFSIVQK